ncbi:phage holin family protein [Chryseobacterium indologenes]|uniref:phage holin family protein n=1 Tax=Chryseobacterium indologenes TaxID=253 RepID=UPI001627027B|nr:phage holin family protein [Chryseobacterium indologenes]
MEKIFVIICILFGLNMEVFLIVMADLWSGVRKAKKNGVARSSYGFKRTVEKLGRYYNVMFALMIVDSMHMTCIWYLNEFHHYNLIFFPFITLLGSIGLSLIELKSIYEKAEDKQRFHEAGALITTIAKNRSDIEEIAKTVTEYLNNNKAESNEKDNNINSN